MSWSVSVPTSGTSFVRDIRDVDVTIPEYASVETLEQVHFAKEAAVGILSRGVVGTVDSKLSVKLSGHANPSHNPDPDGKWADEAVSISIGVVKPK